jgi:hypothetical protein
MRLFCGDAAVRRNQEGAFYQQRAGAARQFARCAGELQSLGSGTFFGHGDSSFSMVND